VVPEDAVEGQQHLDEIESAVLREIVGESPEELGFVVACNRVLDDIEVVDEVGFAEPVSLESGEDVGFEDLLHETALHEHLGESGLRGLEFVGQELQQNGELSKTALGMLDECLDVALDELRQFLLLHGVQVEPDEIYLG
jgi:hypothetical protein